MSRMIDADALIKIINGLSSLAFIMNGFRECADKRTVEEIVKMIEHMPTIEPEQRWIPCTERLPECEQEVLICTMKRVYVSKKTGMEWCIEPIITPAFYEDGSMLEVDSKWHWEDIDYAGWDEEEDCGIIPEGWWENRHFNPDEVYNNPVDQKVVAWMPLPEPYKKGAHE